MGERERERWNERQGWDRETGEKERVRKNRDGRERERERETGEKEGKRRGERESDRQEKKRKNYKHK